MMSHPEPIELENKIPDEIKPNEVLNEDNSDCLDFKMLTKYSRLSFAS